MTTLSARLLGREGPSAPAAWAACPPGVPLGRALWDVALGAHVCVLCAREAPLPNPPAATTRRAGRRPAGGAGGAWLVEAVVAEVRAAGRAGLLRSELHLLLPGSDTEIAAAIRAACATGAIRLVRRGTSRRLVAWGGAP